MSSTLTKIMDEATMTPSTSTPTTASSSTTGSDGSGSGSKLWIVLIILAIIVGVTMYFLPFIMNYLSLPEQIVEEEVKKEVDAKKKAKFDQNFLKAKEALDKAGVLEEQGYCYIGTDRGIRSCIDVSAGDKCMSGKIFPRMDICVNPSLRL